MEIDEFLSDLETHLASRLAALDVTTLPSPESSRLLIQEWTVEFISREAARHPEFFNLAALLRNVGSRS